MPERRVLVTGAGGFIGGRMVEMLHASGAATVRASVRRWSTAARIGRLPVEIVLSDITRPEDCARAVEGMDFVIHCAVGSREVIVDGTRNLLQAAKDAGVRRVVHLSTIDVYGQATGKVDESLAFVPTGRVYGDNKIDAEYVAREFAEKGMEIVVLRPTIVYGPFSGLWTVEFAERLQNPPWLLPESVSSGLCNLVYVDDLVAAAMVSLSHPRAPGRAFNINGPDRPTWNAYFRALNDAMGLPPLHPGGEKAARGSAMVMKPVKATAKWMLKHYQKPIMALYQKSDVAKGMMKFAEGMIRKAPSAGEFELYSRHVDIDASLAASAIGFTPKIGMREGIELSVTWLRAHGYIRGAAR